VFAKSTSSSSAEESRCGSQVVLGRSFLAVFPLVKIIGWGQPLERGVASGEDSRISASGGPIDPAREEKERPPARLSSIEGLARVIGDRDLGLRKRERSTGKKAAPLEHRSENWFWPSDV